MEFIELTDCIKRFDSIKLYPFTCTDPNADGYSLLRLQPQGTVNYGRASGVALHAPEHTAKCRAFLKLARSTNADILLFPEYCVEYDLLREIAANETLWPENHKLWVLPCQGVPISDFDVFLAECRDNPGLCLIEDGWSDPAVNKKQFVTALFYCFCVWHTIEKRWKLCFVPQLKTHPMGDGYCKCELPGMCIGDIIYTIDHRLVTLLCADSLNDDITWPKIRENVLGGLILLHPQLNRSPKNEVFLRLLREVVNHTQPGLYVSCNWAAGTNVYPDGEPHKPDICIDLSWSTIYRKHTDSFSEKWLQDQKMQEDNADCGLFGAVMPTEQMEIWYSDSSVHGLLVHLPNPSFSGNGSTQLKRILAAAHYCWDAKKLEWVLAPYSASVLQQRINAIGKEPFLRYSKAVSGSYRFPLDAPNKLKTDRFWALTLTADSEKALKMESLDLPYAWTLLQDEDDLDRGRDALIRLLRLTHILEAPENFPPRFEAIAQNHKFCCHVSEAGHPTVNLASGSAEMLVAFATDDIKAEQYVTQLVRTECHGDKDLAARAVGVFYLDPVTGETCMAPEVSTDITRGDHVNIKGGITDGGD